MKVKDYVIANKATLCDKVMTDDQVYDKIKAGVPCVVSDIPNANNQTEAVKKEFKDYCGKPTSGAQFLTVSFAFLLAVLQIQKLFY